MSVVSCSDSLEVLKTVVDRRKEYVLHKRPNYVTYEVWAEDSVNGGRGL